MVRQHDDYSDHKIEQLLTLLPLRNVTMRKFSPTDATWKLPGLPNTHQSCKLPYHTYHAGDQVLTLSSAKISTSQHLAPVIIHVT